MTSAVGEIVADRWELCEVIGRGGHSVILRARDRRGGADVAVKVLQDGLLDHTELALRMWREYRALETLAGTAAVRPHALCMRDDGTPCLVMELLAGRDLDDELAVRPESRLAPSELSTLLDPIVTTLEAAHEHDVVHRDVKPGNVFVVDDPRDRLGVRLLDFGLVKVRREKPLTRKDMIIGSPSYIAPEMWDGHAAASDHRVDVYSLAVVIFRALAGRVPFEGDSLKQKVRLVKSGPRPSLHAERPELPAAVDEWVAQALAVDPNRRFARVRAMWAALHDALSLPLPVDARVVRGVAGDVI